jgi:hypothetical protein
MFAYTGDEGSLNVASISRAQKASNEKETGKGSKRMKTEVPHIKPSTTIETSSKARMLTVSWRN